MPKELYEFKERVAVAGWHDGDTFYGAIDQGVGIFRAGGIRVDLLTWMIVLEPIRIRCAVIQAPELKVDGVINPLGVESLKYAQLLAPVGVYPCITYKADDTFDRPLVDLILPSGNLFSSEMLNAGHAVPYK